MTNRVIKCGIAIYSLFFYSLCFANSCELSAAMASKNGFQILHGTDNNKLQKLYNQIFVGYEDLFYIPSATIKFLDNYNARIKSGRKTIILPEEMFDDANDGYEMVSINRFKRVDFPNQEFVFIRSVGGMFEESMEEYYSIYLHNIDTNKFTKLGDKSFYVKYKSYPPATEEDNFVPMLLLDKSNTVDVYSYADGTDKNQCEIGTFQVSN